MADVSTYLRYLPPVLWGREPVPPDFSLGAMLRIFEKLLTGIGDGIVITRGEKTYPPVQTVIANIDRLFDAWTTPAAFLPYLAQWVALEISPLWSEYQTRKAIAGIVPIYRKRGLKSGMYDYLDLYSVDPARPRIAIDNGSKVLFARPLANQSVPVSTLVSQGLFVRADDSVAYPGLYKPRCIALSPDGSLFVGDDGTGSAPFSLDSRVWHLSAGGRYDLVGQPPMPKFIGPAPAAWPLVLVVAVAVRNVAPLELYVLDGSNNIYQLLGPDFSAQTTLTNVGVSPVAMTVDNDGNLLVLDRGSVYPAPAAPQVIAVTIAPLALTTTSLTLPIEPLSILVLADGSLIIGDGRSQAPVAPGDFAGNLLHVDRTAAPWSETLLLPVPPAGANPLVAPTAVVAEDDTHLLVLDAGLKPFIPDPGTPFTSAVAEPARIYRVDRSTVPPVVTTACDPGNMVFPTGMVYDKGTLYICDPGLFQVAGVEAPISRALPNRFSVIAHFCSQRLPTPQGSEQLIGGIHDILDQQKAAASLYDVVTEAVI